MNNTYEIGHEIKIEQKIKIILCFENRTKEYSVTRLPYRNGWDKQSKGKRILARHGTLEEYYGNT